MLIRTFRGAGREILEARLFPPNTGAMLSQSLAGCSLEDRYKSCNNDLI